jgi:hypothetical protein
MNTEYYEQKTKRLYAELEKADETNGKLYRTILRREKTIAELQERYLQVLQENKTMKRTIKMIEGAK